MTAFEFSERTLSDLERVQGPRGVARGKIDRRGNLKLARALGGVIRLPHELTFAGVARVSEAIVNRGGVQSNAQRTARALQQIDRTAKRTPQVMVKKTSRLHGSASTLGAMTYIGRLGMADQEPLGVETSEGKHLLSAEDMRTLAREWDQWERADEARRQGATAIAMVFSMPPGTDAEKVKESVRAIAESDLANRRWVMQLHTDAAHPHVHLIIANRDAEGRRFNPNLEFFQHCRERFAEELRVRGVEADATKRVSRAYPPKQEKTPVLRMRERLQEPGKGEQVTRADRGRVAMLDGHDPVEQARMKKREEARKKTFQNIETVRAVYGQAVSELQAHGGKEEVERAKALQSFIDAIPPAPDARTEVIEQLRRGDALPDRYQKDPALERLKSRVRNRDEQLRAEALARIDKATERVRAKSAELKAAGKASGEGQGEQTAFDRVRAKTAELKSAKANSAAVRPHDALAAARDRLQAMQRKVDKAVKDHDRSRDRSREPDKDRGGPSR